MRVLSDEIRNEHWLVDRRGRDIDPADLACGVDDCSCKTCADEAKCKACQDCRASFSPTFNCEDYVDKDACTAYDRGECKGCVNQICPLKEA